MRNYITYAGQDLRDFGLYISGSGTYNAPERQYDEIIVPGRNGVLLGDQKRMENIELTYPAFMYANFRENMRALRSYLLSLSGYQRLVDTYHPDEYRMAVYRGGTEAEMLENLRAGSFDLTFWCKPQRYLLSGEETVTFTANGTITNPTLFEAMPLIRAYGVGQFVIGPVTVEILSSAGEYTDFDCETCDAYYGTASRNLAVKVTGGTAHSFPTLKAGTSTTVTLLTGITKLEITPRWWQV